MFVRNLEINMFVFAGKIWRFDAAGFNHCVYHVGDWFLIDCWDSHFDLRVFPSNE